MNMEALRKNDAVIADAIDQELARQRDCIELIASENIVSEAVMEAMGTVLTNKYAEGYAGKRYYGGCEKVDIVERVAIERACELFNCNFANVQPHSGANANFAAYFATVTPGDTIMGMSLDHGGHLTHGSPANFSGKYFNVVPYGLNPETEMLDYDAILAQAKEVHPKLIVAGSSAYPRIIDFACLREIADEVGAKLMVDMAHIAGLVATGAHPSPLPYADIVTTTTHKTLRGPRGGMILTNDEALAKKINSAVFPGTQGGPLMHIIAAKAVAFGEALHPEFKTYINNVVENCAAMGEGMIDSGLRLVSGGTDNHLMLVDLSAEDVTGKELEKRLDEAHITCNKNTIPNDPRSPFVTSGVRLGTPAVTTRGMKEDDMDVIAECISLVLKSEDNVPKVKAMVEELTKKYPLVQ